MSDDDIWDAVDNMDESPSRKAKALAELWRACGDDERQSLRNVFWATFQRYIPKEPA